MGDIGGFRIAVCMIKECQVTWLRVCQRCNQFTLSHLFTSIAEEIDSHSRIDYLRETRAVHTHEILAAPEVGSVEQRLSNRCEIATL